MAEYHKLEAEADRSAHPSAEEDTSILPKSPTVSMSDQSFFSTHSTFAPTAPDAERNVNTSSASKRSSSAIQDFPPDSGSVISRRSAEVAPMSRVSWAPLSIKTLEDDEESDSVAHCDSVYSNTPAMFDNQDSQDDSCSSDNRDDHKVMPDLRLSWSPRFETIIPDTLEELPAVPRSRGSERRSTLTSMLSRFATHFHRPKTSLPPPHTSGLTYSQVSEFLDSASPALSGGIRSAWSRVRSKDSLPRSRIWRSGIGFRENMRSAISYAINPSIREDKRAANVVRGWISEQDSALSGWTSHVSDTGIVGFEKDDWSAWREGTIASIGG